MKTTWILVAMASFVTAAATGTADRFRWQGAALYAERCAFCHGEDGRGHGPVAATLKPQPPDFTSPEFWSNMTTERIRRSIAEGVKGTPMLGQKDSLSPPEIDALVAYVETFRTAAASAQPR